MLTFIEKTASDIFASVPKRSCLFPSRSLALRNERRGWALKLLIRKYRDSGTEIPAALTAFAAAILSLGKHPPVFGKLPGRAFLRKFLLGKAAERQVRPFSHGRPTDAVRCYE